MIQSNITPFDFKGHDIRIVQDESGEPWFVAVDMCEVLSLENVSQAISRLDDDERGIVSNDTLGLAKSGAIVRIGRKVLIDETKFFAWVESQNQGSSK